MLFIRLDQSSLINHCAGVVGGFSKKNFGGDVRHASQNLTLFMTKICDITYGIYYLFQALSEIRTHDLCDAGAVLSQLSYQSNMGAVVYGLAFYMETFRLGPSTVKMKVICPIVATE